MTFGILPAWQLSRTIIFKHSPRAATRQPRRISTTRLAGVGQLVLATVLLVGAGLLTTSFVRLATFNKGYDPSQVLAFNLLFPDRYSSVRKGETIEELLHRFAEPGRRCGLRAPWPR